MLLKDAIMFLHHGIELLMKEILVCHSPYLIFEELKDLPRKQKLADKQGISIFSIDKPPRTVTYEVACERVEAFIKSAELNDKLLGNLEELNRLRNKLEHHEIEADRQEVEELLLAIHDPLLRLFEAHIGKLNQLQTSQAKQIWNNIIRDAGLTRFNFIQSVRPIDGARIAAKRVIVDENMPIRWVIVVKDKMENFIFNELPLFEDTEGRVPKQYSTSELSDRARKVGFVDWQQAPLALVEGWELIGEEYRKRLIPQYQLPDPTNYPVD